MKPVIGITSDYDLGISNQSISPGNAYFYLNKNYCTAVEKSNGVPMLLSVTQHEEVVDAYLETISGLIVSGSGDLDPCYYGEDPLPGLGPINPERQSFEVMIVQRAIEKQTPVLGICGGAQLLNVVAGGSLFQDIAAQVPGALSHRPRAPRWYPFHTIRIHPESRLRQILKVDTLKVNSRHHQSVKTLGKGVMVNAEAADGIVEGIEMAGHPFAMGVQWHPEEGFERGDVYSKALFHSFIKAAKDTGNGKKVFR